MLKVRARVYPGGVISSWNHQKQTAIYSMLPSAIWFSDSVESGVTKASRDQAAHETPF
jgi:hypothetical protein